MPAESAPPTVHFVLSYLSLRLFSAHLGGMVEGCPPSDSVTPVTVDIFIEPTGMVNILSAQDQVSNLMSS